MIDPFDRLSHRQCLEDIRCLQTDIHVIRHQRQVGVQTGGLLVVVSGTDLGIIFDLFIGFLGDQTEFGMYFVTIQTVDHATARILQKTGPSDIIFLVKTGFQFHQYQHFFSVLCGFDQGFHDFTLFCHTVQCHLNRNNIFIVGCLVKHI